MTPVSYGREIGLVSATVVFEWHILICSFVYGTSSGKAKAGMDSG
jgi:hypothetical protein